MESQQILHNINDCLWAVEKVHGMRVLYACESGSRSWGFESTDSDYDVRYLFAYQLRDYLTVGNVTPHFQEQVNSIENPVDLVGWNITKALSLLRKSNPSLLEWLYAPIVYYNEIELLAELRDIAQTYFSPKASAHHYMNMAGSNWRNYVVALDRPRLKKYLYAIRPAMCARYVITNRYMPPIKFGDLRKKVALPGDVQVELDKLLSLKSESTEDRTSARIPCLDIFIEDTLTEWREAATSMVPVKACPVERLDNIFHKVVGA